MPDEEYLDGFNEDSESYDFASFASMLMVNAIIGSSVSILGDSCISLEVDSSFVAPGNDRGLVVYLSELAGVLSGFQLHVGTGYFPFFEHISEDIENNPVEMPFKGVIKLDKELMDAAHKECSRIAN